MYTNIHGFFAVKNKFFKIAGKVSFSELAVILGVHKNDKTHVYGFFGIDLHET